MKKIIVGLLFSVLVVACSVPPRPENTVIQGINFIGVSVSDIEQSASFYGDIVDLKTVSKNNLSQLDVVKTLAGRGDLTGPTRMMKSTNGQLRFMQFDKRSPEAQASPKIDVNGPGFAHVCFQVAKKTQAHERFLARGATPVGSREMVQLNPKRPVEYAYIRDLDNIMFEVEHVDIAKLNLDTPPKNNFRMRHVAIATTDYDRAVEFYSILFEQKRPRRIGRFFNLSGENFDNVSGLSDTKLKMAFFQVRNMEFEIAEYLSHPGKPLAKPRPIDALGYNMVVFDVTSLNAAREKLIAAGGSVVEGGVMPMDGGQILFGRDLDGNLIGFQKVSSESVASSQNFKDNGI